MMKLWAAIKKDFRILLRDKVGLSLMFLMPILLVIIVTVIQNNTFDLLNKNSVPLVICSNDAGSASKQFIEAIDKIGMFHVQQINDESEKQFADYLHKNNSSIGIFIPSNFSDLINTKAATISSKALNSFGLQGDSVTQNHSSNSAFTFYYDPEIQPSFKLSIQGALSSALQMIESKQVLRSLYFSINEKPLPDSLENDMLNSDIKISEVSLSLNNNEGVPNATQHNVPAWTIFAMFFIIMSLGGSVVREKISGSFIRLKTLPTNFYMALLSKQIVFLIVTFLQAAIIFAIGIFLFPKIGLPAMQLPADVSTLLSVTFFCGWCAVSYAICVGVFANTQEQANGFGAISIVIFAVIGGLMVPSFAMPDSFKSIMQISPLHWCLEAYYGLFLKGGKLGDVLNNILPIFVTIIVMQLLILWGLKRKKLI
ncbi:MAG: ABC transporter permease [Arachidicoccus sp.]|nr:ABC transporter permease [Arachidicoccus sp.]